MLADLGDRARRLVASGRESKFERLREVLEDPRHAEIDGLLATVSAELKVG